MTRVTTTMVRRIRQMLLDGQSIRGTAKSLGVSHTVVKKYRSDEAIAAAQDKEKRRYAKKVRDREKERQT